MKTDVKINIIFQLRRALIISISENAISQIEVTATIITTIGETTPAETAASPNTNAPTILMAVPAALGALKSLSLKTSNVIPNNKTSKKVGNGTPCCCMAIEIKNSSGINS